MFHEDGKATRMPTHIPSLIRSEGPTGEPIVRLGQPLLDDYLEFLSGRCRPNTVLAVAFDLKVSSRSWASTRGGCGRLTCWPS